MQIFPVVSLIERSREAYSSSSVTHPAVTLPLLGPCPLGIATELPATGVALAHDSCSPATSAAGGSSGRSQEAAPIASATSPSARKLCPLTSASQCGSAATMPPARGAKALALTRG